MSSVIPVILSGGSGMRLWPVSRSLSPKQFLPILDENTLFQSTIQRLGGISDIQDPLVVCNEDHRFMVVEQLRELGVHSQGILLEPVARNTAPAIALAALYAREVNDEEVLLLVLPSDHIIRDVDSFRKAVERAVELAKQGRLVTFGIVPSSPETGYGYIQHDGGTQVLRFVEKPNRKTAEDYLDAQDYLWNSGMFVFQVGSFQKALQKFQPDMLEVVEQVVQSSQKDCDFVRFDAGGVEKCPNISIDYAVMEQADNVSVVPLDASWNDMGAWSSVWEEGGKDSNGNVFRGDVLAHATKNSLVYTEQRLVAVLGVDDLVVVDTKDATLVVRRDQVQNVKQLVEELKESQRPEADSHREIFRPWGSYDSIDRSDRFHVKRITVNPGAKLSKQMHYHRAEHWIVVRGTAKVQCGEKTMLLTENQSTYIPLGEVHSLENPGKVSLEIIEVQSGSYLGEDDIIRFEDKYGRS